MITNKVIVNSAYKAEITDNLQIQSYKIKIIYSNCLENIIEDASAALALSISLP